MPTPQERVGYLETLAVDEYVLLALLHKHATFIVGPRHLGFVEFFIDGKRYECRTNDVGMPVTNEQPYLDFADACRDKLIEEYRK